jgi:hypothetical protein
MDSFQGAVLSIKPAPDEWNTARIDRARQYTKLLKNSSYKLPAHISDSECVWQHGLKLQARSRPPALQDIGSECHSLSCADSPPAYASIIDQATASDGSTVRTLSLLPIYPNSLKKECPVSPVLLDLENADAAGTIAARTKSRLIRPISDDQEWQRNAIMFSVSFMRRN